MKTVLLFILTIAIAWAYIHVGFFVIDLVETRVWADMSIKERFQVLTGSVLVISSIFWIYAIDKIMGMKNGQ